MSETIAVQHDAGTETQVYTRFSDGRPCTYRHKAKCSCGWFTDWFASYDAARWAAEDHKDENA